MKIIILWNQTPSGMNAPRWNKHRNNCPLTPFSTTVIMHHVEPINNNAKKYLYILEKMRNQSASWNLSSAEIRQSIELVQQGINPHLTIEPLLKKEQVISLLNIVTREEYIKMGQYYQEEEIETLLAKNL